jgi:selenoprotein W-related protein
LSAAIRQHHPDAQVELVPGSRGVFNVDLDGERIWDKQERGGFPPPQAILDSIRGR